MLFQSTLVIIIKASMDFVPRIDNICVIPFALLKDVVESDKNEIKKEYVIPMSGTNVR